MKLLSHKSSALTTGKATLKKQVMRILRQRCSFLHISYSKFSYRHKNNYRSLACSAQTAPVVIFSHWCKWR